MNKVYYFIAAMLLFCSSCSDFLNEYSSDLAYANSCKDLEEVMLGEGYMARPRTIAVTLPRLSGSEALYFPWIHVMDDDFEEYYYNKISGVQYVANSFSEFFRWQKNPFMVDGEAIEDESWRKLYKHIAVLNVILAKVNDFQDDELELRNRLMGEAYFLRGYYYFALVNLYGKPYNKETAATDLGVTLKLTEYVEDKYYSRNTVAEVYKQVLSDLNESAKYFSGLPVISVRRASEAAVHLLLSRVYLYMADWENAVSECDKIKGSYRLDNLNGRDETKSFITESSPELIFSQGPYSIPMFLREPDRGTFCYQISQQLIAMYDMGTDLRRNHFFKIHPNAPTLLIGAKMKKDADWLFSDVCLMRYAEVVLNKAEALAMQGQDSEAAGVLALLLESRLTKTETIDKTGKDLITLIRNERRKELCMEGHRWFDLRRYAVCPKYPEQIEIRHQHYNLDLTFEGAYLLKKYDDESGAGYVMPIPDYAIIFNNGAMVNNDRIDRGKIY